MKRNSPMSCKYHTNNALMTGSAMGGGVIPSDVESSVFDEHLLKMAMSAKNILKNLFQEADNDNKLYKIFKKRMVTSSAYDEDDFHLNDMQYPDKLAHGFYRAFFYDDIQRESDYIFDTLSLSKSQLSRVTALALNLDDMNWIAKTQLKDYHFMKTSFKDTIKEYRKAKDINKDTEFLMATSSAENDIQKSYKRVSFNEWDMNSVSLKRNSLFLKGEVEFDITVDGKKGKLRFFCENKANDDYGFEIESSDGTILPEGRSGFTYKDIYAFLTDINSIETAKKRIMNRYDACGEVFDEYFD